MKSKKWESSIPQPAKRNKAKKLYAIFRPIFDEDDYAWKDRYEMKVVWLNNKQVTLHKMAYPDDHVRQIIRKDSLEYFANHKDWRDKTLEDPGMTVYKTGNWDDEFIT